MSTPIFNWSEFEAELDDPASNIPFTPVTRLRARRRGWSEERQRAFIFALSRCGSAGRAARAVGMSPRSAYQLLDAPDADSFAEAWDQAIDEGVEWVRADALQRALGGVFVPVFRRGKLVRVEHRQSDALAIALLNGREKSIDDYRRNAATRRRKLRQDFAELDRQRAEEERKREQVWAEHQAILDRLEMDKLLASRREPRIRQL